MSTEDQRDEPEEWFADLPPYLQQLLVDLAPDRFPQSWVTEPYATPEYFQRWQQISWGGWAAPASLAPFYALSMARVGARAGWLPNEMWQYTYAGREFMAAQTAMQYAGYGTPYGQMQTQLWGARAAYWGAQQQWAPIAETWSAARLASFMFPEFGLIRAYGFSFYGAAQQMFAGAMMAPNVQAAVQAGGPSAVSRIMGSVSFWPGQYGAPGAGPMETVLAQLISGVGEWTAAQTLLWGLGGRGIAATFRQTAFISLTQAGLGLIGQPLATLAVRQMWGVPTTSQEYAGIGVQLAAGGAMIGGGILGGLRWGFMPQLGGGLYAQDVMGRALTQGFQYEVQWQRLSFGPMLGVPTRFDVELRAGLGLEPLGVAKFPRERRWIWPVEDLTGFGRLTRMMGSIVGGLIGGELAAAGAQWAISAFGARVGAPAERIRNVQNIMVPLAGFGGFWAGSYLLAQAGAEAVWPITIAYGAVEATQALTEPTEAAYGTMMGHFAPGAFRPTIPNMTDILSTARGRMYSAMQGYAPETWAGWQGIRQYGAGAYQTPQQARWYGGWQAVAQSIINIANLERQVYPTVRGGVAPWGPQGTGAALARYYEPVYPSAPWESMTLGLQGLGGVYGPTTRGVYMGGNVYAGAPGGLGALMTGPYNPYGGMATGNIQWGLYGPAEYSNLQFPGWMYGQAGNVIDVAWAGQIGEWNRQYQAQREMLYRQVAYQYTPMTVTDYWGVGAPSWKQGLTYTGITPTTRTVDVLTRREWDLQQGVPGVPYAPSFYGPAFQPPMVATWKGYREARPGDLAYEAYRQMYLNITGDWAVTGPYGRNLTWTPTYPEQTYEEWRAENVFTREGRDYYYRQYTSGPYGGTQWIETPVGGRKRGQWARGGGGGAPARTVAPRMEEYLYWGGKEGFMNIPISELDYLMSGMLKGYAAVPSAPGAKPIYGALGQVGEDIRAAYRARREEAINYRTQVGVGMGNPFATGKAAVEWAARTGQTLTGYWGIGGIGGWDYQWAWFSLAHGTGAYQWLSALSDPMGVLFSIAMSGTVLGRGRGLLATWEKLFRGTYPPTQEQLAAFAMSEAGQAMLEKFVPTGDRLSGLGAKAWAKYQAAITGGQAGQLVVAPSTWEELMAGEPGYGMRTLSTYPRTGSYTSYGGGYAGYGGGYTATGAGVSASPIAAGGYDAAREQWRSTVQAGQEYNIYRSWWDPRYTTRKQGSSTYDRDAAFRAWEEERAMELGYLAELWSIEDVTEETALNMVQDEVLYLAETGESTELDAGFLLRRISERG